MPINKQNITIVAGVITLVIPAGEETSSGVYLVANEAAALTDEITQIQGIGSAGSADEMFELRLQSSAQVWTLVHNPSLGITLIRGLDFTPGTPNDYIVLRGTGSNMAIEFMRVNF